jgi:hypothetical protein
VRTQRRAATLPVSFFDRPADVVAPDLLGALVVSRVDGVRMTQILFDPLSENLRTDGLFWIDEDAKRETLEARASGRAFEPVSIVDETWRVD